MSSPSISSGGSDLDFTVAIVQPAAPTSTLEQTSVDAHANVESPSIRLSDSKISEGRRRQLDVINKLRSLGVQREIDIPEIVVIGSQSAGKSSLIESLSGITLPRASGTCTRCPIECRLAHSTAGWMCTVSLRYMDDASGHPLDEIKNVQFGPIIERPKEVEERVRRAQLAALNPSVDFQSFLKGNYPRSVSELDFTRNIVSVEIKSQDVTDLSFTDVPGLIASVSEVDRGDDVEKVKQLVSSYISRPSCIILLTVACESDFETQGAYSLAKQHDRDGTRTIGVLTKPDRIPEGEEARWVSLIKDERASLRHGWFCVKQPSLRELDQGVTFLETRHRSDAFFMNPPWSALETRHRRRLGTQAVAQKLNEFLMDEISKRFPMLMLELREMLQKTKQQLQTIPVSTSRDPVLELMHLISNFCDDISRQAEGFCRNVAKHSGNTVLQSNQFEPIGMAHEVFRKVIEATEPDFQPLDRSELQPSERGLSPIPPTIPGVLSACTSPALTCISGEKIPAPHVDEGVLLGRGPIYINDVAELVRKARTRELQGHYPFYVIQGLIARSTNQWEQPAIELVDSIHSIVTRHRTNMINVHFGKYKEARLPQIVSGIMMEHMQQRREECVARIKWLFDLEAHAFTLNKDQLDETRNKLLTSFERRRDIWHRIPQDPNPPAFEIMATVMSYFQVASKRFVDTVPLAIDHEIVRVQKRTIQDALFVGLKVSTPEAHLHCQRLLAEPAEVVVRRSELQSRLATLQAAQIELESF